MTIPDTKQITLAIDAKPVTVPAGTTVLEAARQLGIHIPTLCHVDGLEPVSSCFVCAVQIEGRRNLVPSCALPVAEGMDVTTNSEDVRQARKMALELLLSDHAGECIAPCSAQCPAGLDIPGFVYQIAAGDNARSMEIISERLALPGSLGRVCPRLCEQQCRRCDHDDGLAIGALHRFVADGDKETEKPYVPERPPASGKKIALVGAGPAGLSAAFYLQARGHQCALFDSQPEPGGMLRYGIPEYRLPKKDLDAEIKSIRNLGAEFHLRKTWGADFTLAGLREQYDAVFLGIGAQRAQGLRCEGEELALSGIEFLDLVAKGNPPTLGTDVIVVGGGNTAMDCARSAIRLDPKTVRVIYRRTRREMPCLMEEVEGAEREGVEIDFLVAPVRLESTAQHRLQLTCQHMELGEPDSSGRRRPVPIEGSEFVMECSTVIAAIGQAVDRTLAEQEGLKVSGWGINADDKTMATNLPGVFAGGDAVLGADLAVRAVAAGRIAATSIDQYLRGEKPVGETALTDIAMRPVDDAERAEIFRMIEKAPRVPVPEIGMQRRVTSFDEVEGRLSAADAIREATRCMSCGCRKSDCCDIRTLASEYNASPYRYTGARRRFEQDSTHPEIIYEPGKCIMCDACVRIARQAGEALGVTTIGRGFDVAMAVPFDKPLSDGLRKVAKRCAESCPTGALALRTARSCDLCSSAPSAPPPSDFPMHPSSN